MNIYKYIVFTIYVQNIAHVSINFSFFPDTSAPANPILSRRPAASAPAASASPPAAARATSTTRTPLPPRPTRRADCTVIRGTSRDRAGGAGERKCSDMYFCAYVYLPFPSGLL